MTFPPCPPPSYRTPATRTPSFLSARKRSPERQDERGEMDDKTNDVRRATNDYPSPRPCVPCLAASLSSQQRDWGL
ncbi:uncharacterized protein LY79DRAFT_546243 [Colletotrichum navitas]|uniref:Uncharacterized protein n=1 Tax=Colletotrichum navitas TaxID=681940 RepID=A0AAD8V7H2_9PEZI|nr:uncharacterized protein LY79DRAFT_546243 [Colletotrichum navitas]KAK1595849.1 hypothetical protein LY79DRAFT_546243 [Colletotrichum navitas]